MRASPARELLIAGAVAAALCVAWTWPLAAGMGDRLPFDPREGAFSDSEAHQGPWALWHVAQSVARLEDPFVASELGPPFGQALALEDHALLTGLISLPATWALGAVTASNLARLLLMAGALVATYYLGRAVGLSRRAAALAAAAWALSPHHLEAGLTSLGRGASPWLPLLWLSVLRWSHARSAGARWRGGLASGLAASAALLASPHAGPPAVFSAAVLWLFAPSLDPRTARGARAGTLTAGPLLLGGLLLIATTLPWGLAAARQERDLALDRAGVSEFVADLEVRVPSGEASGPEWGRAPEGPRAVRLLDLAAPPALHPLLRRHEMSAPPRHASVFPGMTVLVLALFALLHEPGTRRWLWLGGVLLFATWDPGGHLARALGALTAVGEGLGSPGALFPGAHLALALGAARGWDALGTQAGGRSLGLFLAVLLPVELLVVPYPTGAVRVPPAVHAIAEHRGEGAVCVLPLADPGEGRPPQLRMVAAALTWQTVHGRPVAIGWVADPAPQTALLWPAIAPDLAPLGMGFGRPSPDGLALDLAHLRADHVLLRTRAARDVEATIEAIDAVPGWTRSDLDDDVLWWFRAAAGE